MAILFLKVVKKVGPNLAHEVLRIMDILSFKIHVEKQHSNTNLG